MIHSSNPLHPDELGCFPRATVRGKWLFAGEEKLDVRGVTYGTFRPDPSGAEFYEPDKVERDFEMMSGQGINAVRTYTVPPIWFLDSALIHGIRVMVGLPWEQHITFLDDRGRPEAIEESVRMGVRACIGHPAVLCYVIGNEIPSSIVRWHGAAQIEAFLRRLYRVVKDEDPDSLVTYVNYPSTEYLQLPFLDFTCFNVYLESRDQLRAYLARLQNIAGDKPLVMAEIGLDSCRNGECAQAEGLEWQIHSVLAAGCAGVFVFAWTDEWHRGGFDIEDWAFGLTDRNRRPKPALDAVRRAFVAGPFGAAHRWPRVTVVVCSYNGARTIRDTCEGLLEVDYPDFEVIVVDDGSTDSTARIARDYGFRVISKENGGLSSARNAGTVAATGEIVAFVDDDARPDRDWLKYLVATLLATDHAGAGGPNIPPPGDGSIASCVANAPGGPMHVLLTDTLAEHIPGCNMAFWKCALDAVSGFDPRYRAAGDDVDLCWRIQDRGWTIGFSPAAFVWHHRRNSVRTYWRQQKGYGRAEALLEQKWPERYNAAGHHGWNGRIYGTGLTRPLPLGRNRIYSGVWATAPFQGLYQHQPGSIVSLPLMPEWHLVTVLFAGMALGGLFWTPLLWALPLLCGSLGASLIQAGRSALNARFREKTTWHLRILTAVLHLIQPIARLTGRIQFGLTPWRQRGMRGFTWPSTRRWVWWSETWKAREAWLEDIETELRDAGVVVARGGEFGRWDLGVRGGMIAGSRILLVAEEHAGGKQLLRVRVIPQWSTTVKVLLGVGLALALALALTRAGVACVLISILLLAIALRALWEAGTSCNAVRHALLDSLGGSPLENT